MVCVVCADIYPEKKHEAFASAKLPRVSMIVLNGYETFTCSTCGTKNIFGKF